MTATPSPATGSAYDAVIVGGGHNGMVCAFYLARRGRKVLVLERREVVGGAAVTEEFHPGFRNSMAAYTVSLLAPDVIREMDLPRHGLTCVLRKASNFLPTEDGRYLLTGRGAESDRAEISKFSARDADAYVKYGERLDRIVPALRNILHATPPSPKGGFMDILNAAQLAFQMNKLDIEGQRDLLDLFARSAGEWLDEWFESDPAAVRAVHAAFIASRVIGAFEGSIARLVAPPAISSVAAAISRAAPAVRREDCPTSPAVDSTCSALSLACCTRPVICSIISLKLEDSCPISSCERW